MDGIDALYNLTGGFETNPTGTDLFLANSLTDFVSGAAFNGLGSFIGGYRGNAAADDFMKAQRKALEDLMKTYIGFAQGILDTQNQYSKENALADAASISEGYKTSAIDAFQKLIPKFASAQATTGSYSNTGIQNLMNEAAASATAKLAAEQSKLTADMISNYRRLQNEAFAAAKIPSIAGNPGAATRNEGAEGDLLGSLVEKGLSAIVGNLIGGFI